MNDLERMLIERACERLVTEYTHLVDHGEAARIADLFTDDGSLLPAAEGREAIRAFLQARQDHAGRASRHVCTNTLIEVHDGDRASGVTYLTLYRHDGEPDRTESPLDGPVYAGEYRDTFVRTADGWRFSRREIVLDFREPGVEG